MSAEPIHLDRITPTGVLVYDGLPHTDGWYEARRVGITATDVAEITCPSKHGDAASVWARKLGLISDDDSEPVGAWDGTGEYARWGTILEPEIARVWAEDNGVEIQPIGILANAERPWMRASLDRVVSGCLDHPDGCLLEVKNRNAFVSGRWSETVPDREYAQVQWQFAVSGFRHGHVATLLGGNTPIAHPIEPDPVIIAYLIREAERVRENVRTLTTPDVVPTGDHLAVLHRIYPERDGGFELDFDTASELAAELAEAVAARKAAKAAAKAADERVKAAEAAVAHLMGDHSHITVPGVDGPAFTLTQKSRAGYVAKPATWWSLTAAPELTEEN